MFKSFNISINFIVSAVLFFLFSICAAAFTFKYYHFGYYDWDLALYSQAMWCIVHQINHASLFGMNFLANHAHFFAFLISPLYAIFEHPLTLIYLKLMFFFSGAYVLFRISREKIPVFLAVLLMVLYIVHPANIFMLLYEFHFANFAPFFIFLMYWFYERKRFAVFMACAVLLCLIKENMPLIVFMFGVYGLIFRKEKRLLWGLCPMILGLGYFLIVMFIIMPIFTQEIGLSGSLYWGLFSPGKDAAALSVGDKIDYYSGVLFSHANKEFLFDLFGPWGIPSLFNLPVLFLGAPIFMQNLLSKAFQNHTIQFHYAATLVPFIFLSSIEFFKVILSFYRKKQIFFLVVLITAIALMQSFSYVPIWAGKVSQWQDRLDFAREKILSQISPDAKVAASLDMLEPLAHRRHAYSLHKIWTGKGHFTKTDHNIPDLEFAAIDFRNEWLTSMLYAAPRRTSHNLRSFFLNDDWHVIDAYEDIVLFRAGAGDGLIEIYPMEESRPAEDIISLEKSSFQLKGRRLLVEYLWASHRKGEDIYEVGLNLKQGDEVVYKKRRIIGYTLYPTVVWKEGELIKEKFIYWLPELLPGKYAIEISLYNWTSENKIKIEGKEFLSLGYLNIK